MYTRNRGAIQYTCIEFDGQNLYVHQYNVLLVDYVHHDVYQYISTSVELILIMIIDYGLRNLQHEFSL